MGVHVVLLPWLSQGHTTPVMHLGGILASQAAFQATLVLTARTHAKLQASSSPFLQQPNIQVEAIDDGLNPDPSYNPSFQELVDSIPTLQQSLEKLLQQLMASSSPVTCLISGTFCSWSKSVACKVGIPRVELWSSPAYIYCVGFYHHLLFSSGLIPLKGDKENIWITCIPGLPPVRASDFVKEFLLTEEEAQADAERVQKTLRYIKDMYGNATEQYRILVNTVYDLDSQALDTLCADGVAAYAIGPLFPQTPSSLQGRAIMYQEDRTCLQWLDGRDDASVLYIAFGSEARMTKVEVQELAHGLEASGQSFLWVIRPGSIVDESTADCDALLPESFRERVAERGKIVAWAPQMEVLAHPAIGGFMSHCGWNSTLETLWLGVPILAWPQRADQGINKKFIEEEWKVGISIQKEGGKITRSGIEKAIRVLMQEGEGAHAREKVKEAQGFLSQAIQEGGSSRKNLDRFIDDLRCLADKKEVV